MPHKTFETYRLWIVPTTSADAPFILELLNTPKWLRFIGDRKIYTIQAAQLYIQERIVSQFDRLGYGNYTLVLKNDGAKIGSCGLYDREGIDGIDLGFALLPDFEGLGFAYEASLRIKEAAAKDFELSTIKAITMVENMASQKLLEKLGLTYEKTIRLAGDDQDLLLYQTILV